LRDADPHRVVEVHVERGLQARGDPDLLRLVLQNLLANAWKFTRMQAHARIAVEVDAQSAQGPTVYVVRDNGVGFDMADAARLFAPFELLRSREKFDGSGLGLAIVRRSVELHGGSVWFSAAVGEGACFFFRL
jgi:signal transduction histidine kinase